MTQFKKIFGSSLFPMSLVILGLFMVCSGGSSMQDIGMEDDYFDDEFLDEEFLSEGEMETDEAYKDELLDRLDDIEGDSEMAMSEESEFPNGSTNDSDFISESNGDSGVNDAESFLTPELFNSMRLEVNELSEISTLKDQVIDSLRTELEEVNYELTTLEASAQSQQLAAKPMRLSGASDAEVYNSEFGMYYQDALDDFYVRNYTRSIRKFRQLIAQGGSSQLLDNCQYWIGEAYYATGNFYQAIAEFQQVLAWEKSNKVNDAQLMIGLAFLKLGDNELARAELNTLVTFATESESAKKARKYLMQLDRV